MPRVCIEPELCSLHYMRLDDVISEIVRLGKGALLAKLDIESAYRMVPWGGSRNLRRGVLLKECARSAPKISG